MEQMEIRRAICSGTEMFNLTRHRSLQKTLLLSKLIVLKMFKKEVYAIFLQNERFAIRTQKFVFHILKSYDSCCI